MPSHFIRFDPDTIQLLDRCMTKAQEIAATLETESDSPDTRTRLASALIEAVGLGEKDEEHLVEFALRVLPAYRERQPRH
ncbi:hypothetical protein [Ancylobacter defluvii]|uniref:Uncharacterized protein n=1 Tax=Ancylobacter defluvii TaxID=1282440 RepID=A0A9W6NCP4_9HYPH|nr:hypothetical protein [Ancylobacter defluvii]MBS7586509.1 hypothetical protein [Ancylobacter defluvii]GLK85796.1 hypothetical protein GCM10017653_38660 [Ancylobacter defluvii]